MKQQKFAWLAGYIKKRFNFLGIFFALLFFWASLSPSLLPRPWYLQGIVSGIVIVIGYAFGVLTSLAIRHVAKKELPHKIKQPSWLVLSIGGGLMTLYQLYGSAAWQREVYQIMGLVRPSDNFVVSTIGVLFTAFLMSYALLILARFFRGLSAVVHRFFLSRKLIIKLPVFVSRVVAAGLTLLVVLSFATDVAPKVLLNMADGIFSGRNASYDTGVEQPTSDLLSGSDDSLVSWESLGRQGRAFIAKGPTTQAINDFTKSDTTLQPIRAYVGMDFSENIKEQARIAVKELQRTNAFDRKALQVVVTTGSGWVDANSTRPLEYIYDGDIATVAIQYSYLPSWLSFLSDQERAKLAGNELIMQVKKAVSTLPTGERPKLYVFGESLGSFGAESGFADAEELAEGTDGVLLVGPPGFNPIHNELTRKRIKTSPQFAPVFEGSPTTVFATSAPTDLVGLIDQKPALIYLQNPTDPVVKWNTDLLFTKPSWVQEQKDMQLLASQFEWRPVVSFFQITVDMVFALKAPAGYGHNYGAQATYAWAQLASEQGWTNEQIESLVRKLQ